MDRYDIIEQLEIDGAVCDGRICASFMARDAEDALAHGYHDTCAPVRAEKHSWTQEELLAVVASLGGTIDVRRDGTDLAPTALAESVMAGDRDMTCALQDGQWYATGDDADYVARHLADDIEAERSQQAI